jgi:hypothetical protein
MMAVAHTKATATIRRVKDLQRQILMHIRRDYPLRGWEG